MTKVFFDICTTLDGYMAPPYDADAMSQEAWMKDWMQVVGWVFPQRFFRENLKLGQGGEEGTENELLAATYKRTGASVMGNIMFGYGAEAWPEEAPFHTPVYVVTHHEREPWERPGGTTFHFVTDGIESALEQARKAARGRDVRIAGGASIVQQYLDAGLVDEFTLHIGPTLLGRGSRVFDNVDVSRIGLEVKEVIGTQGATHVTYRVRASPTRTEA